MDAPVEELGAPAEPLRPSGAPDLGAPSSRAVPTSSGRNGALRGRPNVLATAMSYSTQVTSNLSGLYASAVAGG